MSYYRRKSTYISLLATPMHNQPTHSKVDFKTRDVFTEVIATCFGNYMAYNGATANKLSAATRANRRSKANMCDTCAN